MTEDDCPYKNRCPRGGDDPNNPDKCRNLYPLCPFYQGYKKGWEMRREKAEIGHELLMLRLETSKKNLEAVDQEEDL